MNRGDRIKLGDIRPQITDAPAAPKKPLQGKPGTPGTPGVGWEVQYSELGVDPWHDPPQTFDDQFRRERLVGATEWGPATLIVGTPGVDGAAGQYISVVYKTSVEKPAAPTGNGPVPAGWSGTPYKSEVAEETLWVSRGILNADDTIQGAWSDPHQYLIVADYVRAYIEMASPTITGGIFRTAANGRHVEIGGSTYYASVAFFDNGGAYLGDLSALDNGQGTKYLFLSCAGGIPFYINGDTHILADLDANKLAPSADYVDLQDTTGTFVQDYAGGDPWKLYYNAGIGKLYVSRGTEYHSVAMS